MYTNTRATSTIFVLLVVTATSLLLFSSSTMVGLAASSHLSDSSGKRSEHSPTNDRAGASGNTIVQNAKNSSPSVATINENPNMDSLLACESAAANGSGHPTMSEVMNCYLQFSRGSASSIAVLGDHQNSERAGGSSLPGSTSDHNVDSATTTHSNSHHQGSTNHFSPRHNRTPTG